MNNSVSATSLSADIVSYVRHQLRGRRGLIVAAVALAVPALWLGWPWLVAAGLAPLLIAIAPCAIMCALGLCAMRAGSSTNTRQASCCEQSQSSDEALPTPSAETVTTETAALNAVSHQFSEGSPGKVRAAEVESAGASGAVLNQDNEEKVR
jgi:type III secretory pathway component EscV